jgi:hypothetical protein
MYVPRFSFSITVLPHTIDSASQHNNYRNLAHKTHCKYIPFAIPFEVRVSTFQHFVMNDMASSRSVQSYNRLLNLVAPNGKERVQVRRGDGVVRWVRHSRLGEVDLKAPIEIAFIDQFGQEECICFFIIPFVFSTFRLSDFCSSFFSPIADIDGDTAQIYHRFIQYANETKAIHEHFLRYLVSPAIPYWLLLWILQHFSCSVYKSLLGHLVHPFLCFIGSESN